MSHRNKVLWWVLLAAAFLVAALSFLIGMAPNIVEDDQANVIRCGPALFHVGPRPSALCDAVPDPWRLMAVMGLSIAACMVVAAIALGIWAAVAQRANNIPNPKPRSPRD